MELLLSDEPLFWDVGCHSYLKVMSIGIIECSLSLTHTDTHTHHTLSVLNNPHDI